MFAQTSEPRLSLAEGNWWSGKDKKRDLAWRDTQWRLQTTIHNATSLQKEALQWLAKVHVDDDVEMIQYFSQTSQLRKQLDVPTPRPKAQRLKQGNIILRSAGTNPVHY